MARRRRPLIAGESFEFLVAAVQTVVRSASLDDSGWMDVECQLPAEQAPPFCRALMRLEAELLRGDARLLGTPRAVLRTPDQRRHDAFMLLVERLDTALRHQAGRRRAA